MTKRFEGRTAISTWASRGIGFEIAKRLVADGARVLITARKKEPPDEPVAHLGGPDVALAVGGRADDTDHQGATDSAGDRGPLRRRPPHQQHRHQPGLRPVDRTRPRRRAQDPRGQLPRRAGPTQLVNRAMKKDHGGPAPGIGMYGSNGMLTSMTKLLAVELGADIRVNAGAPAVVKTRFATALYEGREDEVPAQDPLKRLAVPEGHRQRGVVPVSEDAAWLTGQTLGPATVQWILDKAIQEHGAGGLSQDFPLANRCAGIRMLRFAGGPEEVHHKNALAKAEVASQRSTRETR